MSPRGFGLSVLALAGLLGPAGLTFALWPRQAPAALKPSASRSTMQAPTVIAPFGAGPHAPTRFELLRPLRVENQTTRQTRELKLYDASGQIDETAASALDDLLCDARDPKHHETTRINRRTLQLLFKAAYHFDSYAVEVVSAYRKPGRRSEGPHGTGAAIDFRLRGVNARLLARSRRKMGRKRDQLRETWKAGGNVRTRPTWVARGPPAGGRRCE